MLRISRRLTRPTKGNALLIFLILLLGLGLASYFLQSNPDEAQAQGTNIQDTLHIGNTAPSAGGGWWEGPSGNGSYGGGHALWRYRSGNDDPYDQTGFKHYECWQTINVAPPGDPAIWQEDPYGCEPNQSTSDYSLNLGNRSENYGERKNPAPNPLHRTYHRYEFTHDRNRIVNQKPFLAVGHTTRRGFDDPELQLDLWIKVADDITNLQINSSESSGFSHINTLCENEWDNGSNGGVEVTIQGRDRQEETIIARNACGSPHPVISDLGGPVDTAMLTTRSGVYEEYKKYIITARGLDSGGYTNQFRLNVTQPTESFLVAAASKNYVGEIEDSNSFNVSSRLPGDSNYHKAVDQYVRLEILWETIVYVAPDAEDGCTYDDNKYVGIYDSDYPTTTQSWIAHNYPPRLEISFVDRNAFLTSPSSAPFTIKTTLEFNGKWDELGERTFVGGVEKEFKSGDTPIDVDQNKWEDKLVNFQGDKIYKLRFYGMDQRTWIQIRLPFDQINVMQKCAFKPLFKVFYSDISAGGRFGLGETSDACRNQIDVDDLSTTYAGLYAHTIGQRQPPVLQPPTFINVKDSSSAEHGVRVRDTVQTFYSDFNKTGPVPPHAEADRLTFANTTSSYYGGDFGKSRCIPNYWRGASGQQFTTLQTPNQDELNVGGNSGGLATRAEPPTVFHKPNPGSTYVRLTNSTPINNLDLKATIYIEGDLLIEDNIFNNASDTTPPTLTQWQNFNEIGYITIIVKGDILIDPDVSRIDAVLIAYPNTGNDIHNIEDDQKGRIYTCYPDHKLGVDFIDDPNTYTLDKKTDGSTALITNSKLYNNNCATRLVVNGALIAREIHLGRTYVNKTQPYVIGYAVSEEINLLPEYLIGIPILPGFEDWLHRSDSIHILPVNF